MKESKADRFRRVADARVNKIIKMIRLLGNCSGTGVYEYTDTQAAYIFSALQSELDKAKRRFRKPSLGNIYWDHDGGKASELLCFAEYNSERNEGAQICIGTYVSDEDETQYYAPYMAERNNEL